MLISPEKRQKVQEAIKSGTLGGLFTLTTTRNLNQVKTNIVVPSPFGSVTPLTDSNNKILELGAWEAIDECIKQGKRPSTLLHADPYVLTNGNYYWTGGLIAYPKDKKTKMGKELLYHDDNTASHNVIKDYILEVPNGFQDLTGDQMLLLFFNYFQDSTHTPYFQCIDTTFKGNPIKEIIINKPDDLISQGHLFSVKINRKDDWYETDAGLLIPNGAKSDSSNPGARYFWQVDGGSYVGLLQRDDGDDRQGVGAYWVPSDRLRVLVYE